MENSETKTTKAEALKDFWDRKKGAIAVTATATTVALVVVMKKQQKTVYEFLEEKGMKEEFWKHIGATAEDIEYFNANP